MLRKVLLVLLTAAVLSACGSVGAQDGVEDNESTNLLDQIGGDASSDAASGEDEEAAVRLVVEGFGQRLQNVDLLSGEVQSQIRDQYGSFASEDMIEEWLEEPSRAPGREVASPWPDRIEIFTIEAEGPAAYRVHAWVKYVDAQDGPGEASAEQPISLLVEHQGSAWVITNYATTGAYTTLD